MIALESKRAYDSLHVLHLDFTPITPIVWTCHTCIAYSYLLDGIDPI